MAPESIQLAKLTLDVLQLAGIVGVGIYTWLVNRTKVNKQAIERVDGRVQGLERRLERVETDIHHLPGHREIADMHEKVNRVASSLENLRGEVSGVGRTLQLIHQSLLDERNKK